MVRWTLDFLPEAEKDLAKVEREVRRRIIEKLNWLLENFDAVFPEMLTGEFKEFRKLRIGDWRVLYKVNRQNCAITFVILTAAIKFTRKNN